MTTNASRATVDFDAFARDLQQPQAPAPVPAQAPAPVQAPGAAKADPLAELARIVGQDDPFRALLQARDARTDAAARGRIEPSFVDAPAQARTQSYAQAPAHQAAPHPVSPTDAFDQYLASVDNGAYADTQSGYPDPNAAEFAPNDADDRVRPLERPRKRSRLVSVGAGLSVLALCVTGALAWRGLHGHSGTGGGVPTILADTAPLKIAPQKSDGVEIPDQNKQIYERAAKDGQIRIVNREEQPLDVAQAARAALGSGEGGATPGSAAPTAAPAPAQQGGLADSLGEPRRVRTVSVKPDTPPPPPQREASAEATATPTSVIPTMTLPGASGDGATASPSLRQRASRLPPPVATIPVAETPAATPQEPAPAPAPRVKAPQRVAAVAPEATSAIAAPPPVTAAPAAAASGGAGGYAVQLGVRTSESEAQAAFRQMQGKYSQLSGQPALIRQAEVNGKTIYRVRVGPLGKAEAASLCTQLQGAGGQCFVAKN
ncbi:sporulation protein [Methylobacterium sp. Leaf104]|uniref:SPOR domain-containing protein n=1 Tax=Methylobacterium TaxID=407 RepID=UPI0006FC28CC|nr:MULTISPECIES: SPOR domain-containing protein [Methylobacterium]KQP41379.1 sporulation protein [Methylobacterium sp. Leaf104]MCI9881652.1 SPOR domain-containing protein [Methylobacterium goesingense]